MPGCSIPGTVYMPFTINEVGVASVAKYVRVYLPDSETRAKQRFKVDFRPSTDISIECVFVLR